MFLVHTSHAHAELVARSIVGACRGDGWRSPLQPQLLHTLFNELLDCDLDFETIAPATSTEAAEVLTSADERSELVQLLCAIETLCNPVPLDMEETIASWARSLGVDEPSLVFLRELAHGEVDKAVVDLYRLNWIGDLDRLRPGFEALLARAGERAYARTVEEEPATVARWRSLEKCPIGSIGHHLFEFYRKRGFLLPGQVGAANESVAHHDWIHLLSDYGTTPLGEIEVVSFQASCSRAPGAMLGVIAALALFESGVLAGGLITEAFPNEGLSLPGGAARMAEAIERGKACNTDLLLDVDFFTLAGEQLEDLRSRFAIPPKSAGTRKLDPYGALELPPAH